MAVGATYVDGKTGQVVKADITSMLDGPVTVDSGSGTLAADLHAALVTLGLVVDV